MTQQPQDLRQQTLDLVLAAPGATDGSQNTALTRAWLAALDDEDLVGISPASLGPVLLDGFARAATRTRAGCRIEALRYPDGNGWQATALLILNEDMP